MSRQHPIHEQKESGFSTVDRKADDEILDFVMESRAQSSFSPTRISTSRQQHKYSQDAKQARYAAANKIEISCPSSTCP